MDCYSIDFLSPCTRFMLPTKILSVGISYHLLSRVIEHGQINGQSDLAVSQTPVNHALLVPKDLPFQRRELPYGVWDLETQI